MKHPALDDTDPRVRKVLVSLLREAPPWRKIQLLSSACRTGRQLALAGLRQRHENANESELRRRLADHLLGPELAARVYGPPPSE